jgi:prophage regulatory protein
MNDEIEFIPLPEVKKITGLGKTKLYEMISLGEFPKQIPLGVRAARWLKGDVQQWAAERIAAARGGASL